MKEKNKNNELLEKISKEIFVAGTKHEFAGGFFGSMSRNEITPLSDVDILCLAPNGIHKKDESVFQSELQKTVRNFPVDAILYQSSNIVENFALLNGTNYHALYFLSHITGEKNAAQLLQNEQKKLHGMLEERIREFINIIGNFKGLSSFISSKESRYLKFHFHGTNKWVKLGQLAQIRWPELVGKNTEEILGLLADEYGLDRKELYDGWNTILADRIIQEKEFLNKKESSNYPIENKTLSILLEKFLEDSINNWIQKNGGVSQENAASFIQDIFNLKLIISQPKNYSSKADTVLQAMTARKSDEINKIALEYGHDWWVATNLSINKNTNPETLDYLVFPPFFKETFVWRTVRLYVAKNPNTSVQTLQKILNTPDLREQDYQAAKTNLFIHKGLTI